MEQNKQIPRESGFFYEKNMRGKKITGANAVMESLIAENVDTIFGYPGGAIMPIYDALYDYKDKVRHVLVRHEQGAAHAAEGYARTSGKTGVCFATSGPGATNLVTGIADAMLDSVPLVCITGQVASHLVGSDAFQEVDVIGITTPITKWNYQITKGEEISEVMHKAFKIANSGRPGPIVIDITKDVQLNICDYISVKKTKDKQSHLKLDKKLLKQIAGIINQAERPLILAGHGILIANAEKELKLLVEKMDAPVACTLHGLTAIPVNHPNYAGMLGMHGNYAPNVLTNRADVIIALGMRFDDRVTSTTSTYARQATIVHIDIDASEFNKNVGIATSLQADAKIALEKLIPLIKKQSHTSWKEEFHKLHSQEYKQVIEHDIHPSENDRLSMSEVVNQIAELTNGKAIIVTDVGQHQMVTARYYKHTYPNHFITSGGAGTMGFALPAAIGVKVAHPEKEVIAIIGDGSFQMTLQELGTIMQENIPVKVVILNNHYLGMVRQWQELFFTKRYSFVNIDSPDFVTLAKAYNISAKKVIKKSELKKSLQQLWRSKNAYLLEIKVIKETNVFPMIPTGASVDKIRLS